MLAFLNIIVGWVKNLHMKDRKNKWQVGREIRKRNKAEKNPGISSKYWVSKKKVSRGNFQHDPDYLP